MYDFYLKLQYFQINMQHVKTDCRAPIKKIKQPKQVLENKCEFCQNSCYSTNLLKYHLKNKHEQRLKYEIIDLKKDLGRKKIRLAKRMHNLNVEIIKLLLSKL